jgi:hypothetical protein
MTRDLTIETREGPEYTSTHFDRVSPPYFETMGISLLEGRTFSPDEKYTDESARESGTPPRGGSRSSEWWAAHATDWREIPSSLCIILRLPGTRRCC